MRRLAGLWFETRASELEKEKILKDSVQFSIYLKSDQEVTISGWKEKNVEMLKVIENDKKMAGLTAFGWVLFTNSSFHKEGGSIRKMHKEYSKSLFKIQSTKTSSPDIYVKIDLKENMDPEKLYFFIDQVSKILMSETIIIPNVNFKIEIPEQSLPSLIQINTFKI